MAFSEESERQWGVFLRALRRTPAFSLHVLCVHRVELKETPQRLQRLRKQATTPFAWFEGAAGCDQLQYLLHVRQSPS